MDTKTIGYFKKKLDAKKVIVYQSLRFFFVPSLHYERINPNHKILVYGKKKKKYTHGTRNYEKIALILKNYGMMLFMFPLIILLLLNISFADILGLLYGLSIFTGLFLMCILLHEILHLLIFEYYNIKTYSRILFHGFIPYAWGIYSPYFDNTFNGLTNEKKIIYTKIAIAPYFIIFPMSIIFILTNNIIFFILGMSLFFSHVANLPLEFISVVDVKRGKNDC